MRFALRLLTLSLCLFPLVAKSQTILINEVMYDTASRGTNEEWIEIYNAGPTTVNLAGWKFTRGISFTFPALSIAAGGYAIVTADPVWFGNNHPGVDSDIITGRWAGTLANGGESLRLEDPAGNEVDEVDYADQGDWGRRIRVQSVNHFGWDWSAPHSGTGRSAELINPNVRENSGQNWAASLVDGGTPGAANSVLNPNSVAMILDVAHLPLVPRSTNSVIIRARIVEPGSNATVRLFHRVDANPQVNPFTSVPMLDNGATGDGVAGDGVYGAVLPARPDRTIVEYYIETVTATGVTNSWPALANIGGSVLAHAANALYQVDNSTYNGGQPIYRIIMTQAERSTLVQIVSSDRNSDAQMNSTFITIDGTSSELRYLTGVRIRGAGSRGVSPPNLRVNIPTDRRWKDISAINLNSQYTHAQVAGFALAARSGLNTDTTRAVQVRVNGLNEASANSPQFGSYAANEVPNGDYVDAHFPLDNDGNLYRASSGSHSATLAYLGTNVNSYISSGYAKQSNSGENDWSDLISLTFALSANTPNEDYVNAVRQVANVEAWMLYFALFTLTESEETSLGTGRGDDYALYRGVNDPRFLLLAHDWDTILGQGQGSFSITRNIFRAGDVAAIGRFIRHPEFVPIYYATLKRLLDTTFSNQQISQTLDDVLGSWVPAATITAMKQFSANRNTYVLSQIPLQFTVTAPGLPLVGGYPQSSGSPITLTGFADAIRTRSVLVNGSAATWTPLDGRWTRSGVALQPGINRVLVQALDTNGVEFARTNIDVWYNIAATPASGTISTDTSWSPDNGPFSVSGTLTVASGATLTVEPGTSVYFASGARITVANGGRLIAEGTELLPIRFTRVPGTASTWAGILINGAPGSPESRIGYAHIEFNNGTAIDVQGGEVALHHLTFGTTNRRYLNLDGASFTVSDCVFPHATASMEPIHGTGGIRNGGHGIFTRNFFGRVFGYNDPIDFTGGNRPGPILHVIDNVFAGSDDDLLDLDGTDAWVEGNIFLHTHRNGSPDSASAISGGNDSGQTSEITIIGNIFYDVDHAVMAKQGNFYTFINNTVVRQSSAGFQDAGEGAVLNFADEGTSLAAGMYVEGNIVVDAERLTRHLTNGTALANNTTFNNNLMPFTWSGPGTNNSTADPFLIYIPQLSETTNFTSWQSAQVMRDWFATRFGSPARETGPNGRHKGFGVGLQLGASISGEPAPVTAANGATLTVGINRSAPGWASGSGFTHYKWRLDSGAWSAETPINSPIVLSNLTLGAHRVDVSGKRDSGLYQDDPLFAPDAGFTQSRTWLVTNLVGRVIINEVLARNVSAFVHEGELLDVVELFNPGTTTVDLSGKGMTDDPAIRYKFVFPANTLLAPGQYLLVFADTEKITSGLHLGFALDQHGDSLYLFDSVANGGALLDSITFGLQIDDLSIGRISNDLWFLTHPTLGAANSPHPFADASNLKINEWLTESTVGDDFVEILNPNSLPVNIGGSFFTDVPVSAPTLHKIPALSFLPANSYFAFVADGDAELGVNHLSFRLSPDQGEIALFSPDVALIDSVLYGPQSTDVSEGRTPNGSDTRAFFNLPTPGAPNPAVNVTVIVSNAVATLFGVTTQPWRYESSGTDLGTAWRQTNYDDSGWPSGFALFGFETSPGNYPFPFNTFIATPPNGGPITAYFRTHFQWTNGAGWQLFATNYVDDGAVYYINGQEAGRIRITANPVVYTSPGQSPGAEGTPDILTLSTANLVDGDNVLAVEVHQNDSGSTDDVFGMSLAGVKSTTNIIINTIALNEVMANNRSYTNADGTITDWVEIFNPSANAVDLGGLSLTDDIAVPRRWVFPSGVTIASGGYLMVKFDPNSPASTNAGPNLNAGFGFNSGGDRVLLFDRLSNGGGLLDSIQFGLQAADFTIGRIPNGTGAWALNLPTERSANIIAALGNPSALRINEWMADPRPGDDDYFELYNPNAQPVSIGGLFLTDDLNSRTEYRIPNLSFVGVGVHGFVEFIADSNPENGAEHTNFRLSGSGESLGVFGADGVTQVDAITFGNQQSGVSEGRFPDGSSTIVKFPRSPTPGQANFLPFNDVVINEALTHTDLPLEDAIELFNPTANPINIGGWYLSDSQLEPRKFRIPDQTILQPGGFAVFYEYEFNPPALFGLFPAFSLSSENGDEIFLSLTDANGNLTGYRASVDFGPQANGVSFGRFATSIGFDFPPMSARTLGADNPATIEQFRGGRGSSNAYPLVGPIVISEIHYHPPDIGTNENTRDEFIELHNFSASTVPLFDPANPTNTWRLRDAVDFDFPANVSIPAGGYLLVVSFDPAANPTELAAFRAAHGLGPAVTIVGPYVGRLSNDDDEIELRRPDAAVGAAPYVLVERVHYDDALPWPAAADGNTNGAGISLHRVVPQNYANDPVNWVAALPSPAGGSIISSITTPVIALQPTNRAVLVGTSVAFVSSATGSAPLYYQWRHNGIDIPNATNASYVVASAQFTNAGGYSVRVMNAGGVALSATAELAIQAPPEIVFQPQDRNVAAGGTATFAVGARGTPPLGFQWWKGNAPINGATQPALVITNVQAPDLANYFVVVANAFGSATSTVASLAISVAPEITAHPADQTVIIGQTATFSVTATGSAPLSYHWKFNGASLAGATGPTIAFPNVQPSRAGVYSVVVSNAVGFALSSNASLVVIVPPTVTVTATDPNAAEAGLNPGAFTITRNGSNTFPITVNFNVGGSAQNGADYQNIPGQATIPTGSNSVVVSVLPFDDAEVEANETVGLTLTSSPNYLIGSPNNATVTIVDNDNLAPTIAITTPANNTFFPVTPTNILLAATATDANPGQTVRVNFYYGTNNVGQVLAPPYQFTWTNPPSGSNLLVAIATDNLGLSATSAPVAITINGPPLVSITSPANGSSLPVGNVTIGASASDTNGGVARVDFYVGGNLIGSSIVSPYSVALSNAALGGYSTFAVARDTFGLSATSAVVNFSVVPQGTNFADLFANRGLITGSTNFKTGSSAGASKEAGEQNHWMFNAGGRSVWIDWTAPAAGVVTIDLQGSSFDTLLAVYTNAPGLSPTVANIRKIAENDDNGGFLQSRVQFTNTVIGTVFHIAVDGYNGASGNIQMRINVPNPPPIITTQPQSQTNDAGANVTFTVAATSPTPLAYQWRFNGAAIAGATAATLTLNNIQPANAGGYSVLISNSGGVISSAVATLTVRGGATNQPMLVSPRVINGTFSAVVSGGNPNGSYFIEVSTNLTSWSVLTTVTNATGQVSFNDTNIPPSGRLRAYRARLAP